MFGRKVAIADGKPCNEGEVEGLVDPPTLYAPDNKSGPNHDQKNPGQDWPYHTKLLDERREEQTPHLPCLWLIACFFRHASELSAVHGQNAADGQIAFTE